MIPQRIRYWWLAQGRILSIVATSLVAAAGLGTLGFDENYEDLFQANDRVSRDFQRLVATFGGAASDAVVVLRADNWLRPTRLEIVRELHRRIRNIPGVTSVISLHSIRDRRRVGRYWLPLFPESNASGERFESARQRAIAHPLVVGRILSEDQQTTLLVVRFDPKTESHDTRLDKQLAELRGIVQWMTGGTSISAGVTGLPAIRCDTIKRLKSDHWRISVAGAGMASMVAWLLFRRLAAVVIVVVPALVGVLWTLGLMAWSGKNLDAINIVLPAIVLVIGVSDVIHLLLHFQAAMRQGQESGAATETALRMSRKACIVTAGTTSLGFLSLLVSPERIIRQFGLFGAGGVLLTLLAVLSVFPILCKSSLGLWSVAGSTRRRRRGRPRWPDVWLGWIVPHAGGVLLATTVLAVGLGMAASRIHADYHFLENLDASCESWKAMRQLETAFGGAPLLQVLVTLPQRQQVPPSSAAQAHARHRERGVSGELLSALSDVHAVLDRSQTARGPVSILSVVQGLTTEENDLHSGVLELRHIPRQELNSLHRADLGLSLVTAYVPDAGAASLETPLSQLQEDLTTLESRHPGFTFRLSGFSVVGTHRTAPMIMNFLTGLLLELTVIFVAIAWALRSWHLGLVSLPSNLLPLLAAAATIVAWGEPLRFATALAFNICLGIAVDDTVHFLTRYQQEMAHSKSRDDALRRSFRDVAPAMVCQSLVMLAGFATGLLSAIPTVQAFSACACSALLYAFLSEFVIVPSLLAFSWRKGTAAC